MSVSMRPMSLGEILDRTIQIYRKNFLLFAGTALLPTLLLIVMAGGMGVSGGLMGRMDPVVAGIVGSLVFLLIFLLFVPLTLAATAMVNGALTIAAVQINEGEHLTIRAALGTAWKRGWRFIGTEFFVWIFAYILPGAVAFAVLMLFSLLSVTMGASGTGGVEVLFILILLMVCFALFVYVALAMIRLSLSFAAATKEELGPWESVKRSYELTKGSIGRIFLFGLLVYALTMAVTMVIILIAAIPGILVAMMMDKSGTEAQQQIFVAIFLVCYYGGAFLAQVIVKPVYSIGLTVFYFDQRVRKEGYDIERMMEQAGLAGVVETQESAATGAAPAAWFDQVQMDAQKRAGDEQ